MMFSIQEKTTVTTLFEKLGGKAAVDLAVDQFYEWEFSDALIGEVVAVANAPKHSQDALNHLS